MKIFSPNNIDVLLHCHTRPGPHPRLDAPAVRDAINMFYQLECIEQTLEKDEYRTTPKGKAWVQALCNVEEPRKAYVDAQGNILQ